MKFRTPYNYDADVASFSSGLDCSSDPGETQQHMKDETDINLLVNTFARTGVIPGADIPPMVFELDDVVDYQTAMNSLLDTQRAFAALPSNVRDRFANDPARLLEFVGSEANRQEAIDLGLVPAPKVPDLAGEPLPTQGGDIVAPPASSDK